MQMNQQEKIYPLLLMRAIRRRFQLIAPWKLTPLLPVPNPKDPLNQTSITGHQKAQSIVVKIGWWQAKKDPKRNTTAFMIRAMQSRKERSRTRVGNMVVRRNHLQRHALMLNKVSGERTHFFFWINQHCFA